jgi:hypothetical protein
MIAWVFFRCQHFGDAVYVLRAIASPLAFIGFGLGSVTMWVLLIIAFDHYFGSRQISYRARTLTVGGSYWLVLGVLAALALTMIPLAQKAFIYVQF